MAYPDYKIDHREWEMDRVADSDVVGGIRMESLPKDGEYGFLDDICDEDGDSIVANAEPLFRLNGEGFVQATFPQGSDPSYAARMVFN